MDKEEINNNNVLIAEFIGLKKGMLGEYTHPLDKPSEGYVPIYSPDGSDMKFNSDWNWLMPVIKECYEANDNDLMSDLTDKFDFWEMDKMYVAVVEYIKWYNEHTKK